MTDRANPATTSLKEGSPASPARGWAFRLAALLLVVVCGFAGTGLARWLQAPGDEGKEKAAAPPPALAKAFAGWKKPDLALVVTGQQLGYLLPCGCSRPQVGGLERRYNVLKALDRMGWPQVAIDLGDVPQRQGPYDLPNLQGLIKYRYAMMAMKRMGYLATGFGEAEGSLSLINVLAEYALQHEQPRVVAGNLLDADRHFPGMTKTWELSNRGEIRVGATAVLGPTVGDQVMGPVTVGLIQKAKTDAAARAELDKVPVRFGNTPKALDAVLKEMKDARVELPVLLYQGPLTRNKMRRPPTEAIACAEAYPQFRVIVCLSQEDEPSHKPVFVTNAKTGSRSMIVMVGKKGKYAGVVGVWRTGKAADPFTFDYRPVEMTEEWLTPAAEEAGHPIVQLMEDYTRELKRDNYLHKYGQAKHLLQAMPAVPGLKFPGKVTYIGSDKCKRCHESAWNAWKKSEHAHAYDTLVDKAKRPGNRQYDPECIVCHTVGFGHESGFRDEMATKHLQNVGCESCHGPGSVHARNPGNREWRRRMNPWKATPGEAPAEAAKRKLRIDLACQKCHDIDNDVNWIKVGFEKKWATIAHPTPAIEKREPDPDSMAAPAPAPAPAEGLPPGEFVPTVPFP